MKKSGSGKTKGKTKPVAAVKHGKKGDTGKVIHGRRGTNPLVVLIVLPVVLAGGGFLGWYYYKYHHFPLFATQEQRDKTMAEATATWDDISEASKKQWNITKEKWDALDKKFSAEYDAYQQNKEKKRKEMAFLLDEPPAAPAPAPRKVAQKYVPPPTPVAPVPPAHAPAQPTPVPPVPAVNPTPGNTGTPPKPVVTPVSPAPGTGTPVEPPQPVDTPKPIDTPPPIPPKLAYDPQTDSNYTAAAASYEESFKLAEPGDSGDGDPAIKAYTAAIVKIDAAAADWKKVAEKCKTEGVPSSGIEKNLASCADNRKIWEENIATLKKAAAEPAPAAGSGSAVTGSGFYDKNPKWIEGKKAFKEGFDIFNDHISKGTGQSSHILNGFIDKAVERFNKAEECWTAAEDEWLKKYPGTSGPKADAEMLDKAMGESQFFRYGCMKMHTFER